MSNLLTTKEYREALALVLAELRELPTDALEKAERLGRLQSYVATIVGEGRYGLDPINGLAALRRDRERVREP